MYYVVTGINVYLSVGVMLGVCTFYTAFVNMICILVINLFHCKLKSLYFYRVELKQLSGLTLYKYLSCMVPLLQFSLREA